MTDLSEGLNDATAKSGQPDPTKERRVRSDRRKGKDRRQFACRYDGPERRKGKDRRTSVGRRASDDKKQNR